MMLSKTALLACKDLAEYAQVSHMPMAIICQYCIELKQKQAMACFGLMGKNMVMFGLLVIKILLQLFHITLTIIRFLPFMD